MKIVKAELDNEVHTRFKVWCVQQGWSMGEAIERLILERTGGHQYPVREPDSKDAGALMVEVAKKARKQQSVRSYEVKKVEVPSGWSGAPQFKPERQAPLSKGIGAYELAKEHKLGVPVDPAEVPMAKCRKCGESFPVADMVTEPKSGKLFCGDCVANMKNGQ